MKVKELIEELQKQNQEAEVIIMRGDREMPVEQVDGNPASCATDVELS